MADLPAHKTPLDTPQHVPPSQQSAQGPVPKAGEPIRPETPQTPPKPSPTEPAPKMAPVVRAVPKV